jgi:hypothetical protein
MIAALALLRAPIDAVERKKPGAAVAVCAGGAGANERERLPPVGRGGRPSGICDCSVLGPPLLVWCADEVRPAAVDDNGP